jgi:carboxyl-terminal processing protease
MRGLPGTKVQLWVRRPGEPKVLSFEIVREIVHVAAVTSKVLDGRVGYIRIKQFQERTHKEFLDAIVRLREELKGPLAGVLLDLRSNPGGLVDEAAAVADEFLSAGTVFTIRHRGQVMDEVHAHRGGALEGIPVVALVDSWSASASELLVGALQDHGRAVVVGMPTFGKGSVQSVVGLPGGAGLKITTARYYSPKGRALQARGIAPDVVVERPVAPGDMPPLRESDLEGALSEERSAPSVAPARVVQGQDDGQALAMDVREMPSNPLLSKDPTLREGYKLLRERKAPGP